MTSDELLLGANEALAQLADYQVRLLSLHCGKVVKAYGEKVFQVEDVEIKHGGLWLTGSMLRKDGTPSAARSYGTRLDHAEFVV